MEGLNASADALYSVSSFAGMSWIITIVIFLVVILTLWFLSRNFRTCVIGSVITGASIGVYKFSRWIGVETSIEKNYLPISWFGYIVGFIVVAIIVGKLAEKTKFVKNIEKSMEGLK